MGGDVVGFPPLVDAGLEAEAQLTFAAYEAYYPIEPWAVVGVERYFEVKLPCVGKGHLGSCFDYKCVPHTYIGEMDAVVRMKDSGRLWLLETKTEKRRGKANLPLAWQQKTQVSLYLWAAEQIYGQEFEGILLNVITRQSPKGEAPPSFRRDNLFRSKAQQQGDVQDIVWVANRIEEGRRVGWFPSNRNECVSRYGWACDYLPLHQTETRPAEIVQIKFQQAEEYLSGL